MNVEGEGGGIGANGMLSTYHHYIIIIIYSKRVNEHAINMG